MTSALVKQAGRIQPLALQGNSQAGVQRIAVTLNRTAAPPLAPVLQCPRRQNRSYPLVTALITRNPDK
jgi:hypothetical protein